MVLIKVRYMNLKICFQLQVRLTAIMGKKLLFSDHVLRFIYRDADDAVRGRDGYEFDGRRIRVEFTRGSQNNRREVSRSRGNSSSYSSRSGRGVPPRRSSNRVLVKGLPPTGSWQDIKDHLREAGEVLYAEVYGDGTGIVEFAHSDDVRYAVKNLDDTEFRSHEVGSSL